MKKTIQPWRWILAGLLVFSLSACGPRLEPGSTLKLATLAQRSITVAVSLEIDEAGQTWLVAAFKPDDPGLHMYSKDLPREGENGLGRPTLLELVPGTRLKALGELNESVEALPDADLDDLPVYPAGPVTLRLPVSLPEGEGWFDEQVSVTYMACSQSACIPPVENQLIAVRLPGTQELIP
jgi:hypothetical protein